jgi:hypothetical protein
MRWVRRLLVTVATASLLLGATQVAAAVRHKPDLIVRSGNIRLQPDGTFFATRFQNRRFTWNQRTKNVGDAAARSSRTEMRFLLDPGGYFVADRLWVPRLDPGESSGTHGDFRINFVNDGFAYGKYPTRICADGLHAVDESHEGNNCKGLHPFYVVPYDLQGQISGSVAVQPGVTLAWSGAATFELDGVGHANEGGFVYHRVVASVSFTVSGSTAGCIWTGSGTYTPADPADRINLNFGASHAVYAAHTKTSTSYHFPARITCPGAAPIDFELFPANSMLGWLATGSKNLHLQGFTGLRGRYSALNGAVTVSWQWRLDADG